MSDDNIWEEFLKSLYDDNLYCDDDNEEINDPEYSVGQDIKFDDDWDLRNDKAVKVTDYELNLLLDDHQNELSLESIDTAIECDSLCVDSSALSATSIALLVQQMQQHVQLLTQTYVQTVNSKTLTPIAGTAKGLLNELSDSSNKDAVSVFKVPTLQPSLQLINSISLEPCIQSNLLTSWRSLPVKEENQLMFVSNPKVFAYDWLLPHCGYYDEVSDRNRANKFKTVFTHSEDQLIALGLEQFMSCCSPRQCYRYIKQLMIPIKTVDQIRMRIKNLKRRLNSSEMTRNPIVYYFINGHTLSDSHFVDSRKTQPKWHKNLMKSKIYKNIIMNEGNAMYLKRNRSLESQSERKRNKSTQSPVKQKNSIFKKYRYLNKINAKQTLSTASNINTNNNNLCADFNSTKDTKLNSNLSKSSTETNDRENIECTQELGLSKHENTIALNQIENSNNGVPYSDTFIVNDLHRNLELNNNNNNSDNEMDNNEKFSKDKKAINNNEDEGEFDDESDLAALMTASSTITTANKIRSKNSDLLNPSILSTSHKKESRKSQAIKQRESTLQLLSFEWNKNDPNLEHREELLVNYFLDKVRKSLSNDNYICFLTLLSEFDSKRKEVSLNKGMIKNLYYRMESFLLQLNVSEEIISEFVLFLSAEQAEECGKMFEYLHWKRFFNFIRKLEIYSSGDPQCLHRLIRSLNQLKQNEEKIDKSKMKSTLSRVLNGHQYLMHEFSSLFLDEKPSQYLFEDEDFDIITMDSSDDDKNGEFTNIYYENINIPTTDYELKYGTNECPCKVCHTTSVIARHCTSCSIRFIDGRPYLMQTSKKLSLAEIHYHYNEIQENAIKTQANEDEEDVCIESDNDIENDTEKEQKWTISEDRMLLELCRAKIDDSCNTISKEIFDDIANQLCKCTSLVIARFNELMKMIAINQQEISHDIEDIEIC